jgi:hypothetical protein
VTLWHRSRDSPERLLQLLPWRGAQLRVRPKLFAMSSSVAAVLVTLHTEGCVAHDTEASPQAVPCFNSHPHLTVWIAKKGLARLSNHLLARVASPDGELWPVGEGEAHACGEETAGTAEDRAALADAVACSMSPAHGMCELRGSVLFYD